jgi:hypothetical protein
MGRGATELEILYPILTGALAARRPEEIGAVTADGASGILVAGHAANVSFPHDRQLDAAMSPRPRAVRSSGPSPAGWPPAGSRRVAGITSPPVLSVERTGARGRSVRPTGLMLGRLAKVA